MKSLGNPLVRGLSASGEAFTLLGSGVFLPVHWGTFSLAMHAWDQPAEVLQELGLKTGAQMVMPRLGEPVEPSHVDGLQPRCRSVDADARGPELGAGGR